MGSDSLAEDAPVVVIVALDSSRRGQGARRRLDADESFRLRPTPI